MNKVIILAGLSALSFAVPGLVLTYQAKPNNELAVQLAALFAADTKPTDSCHTAFDAVVAGAPKKGDYTHPILDHLHDELYRANSIETADIEMIFCRLVNVMGFNPDLTALPQTLSKTDPRGSTVVVTVTTPTETWATAAGYTAKATLTNDGTQFLALWWAGSGDTSKGYVIQGSNPMQTDTTKRLRYAMWDKSTSTQVVKVYAAQFATSVLGSVTGATDSKTGGDNAHFARVSYDTATKAITSQAIEIRAGKTATTSFKCVRTYFTGTLGGSISGYRPALGVEEGVLETSTGGATAITGGTGMDGETGITDATTTADHTGTASAGTALATGTFDWSCNDINGSGTTGKPFASNTVAFDTAPTTVFPK